MSDPPLQLPSLGPKSRQMLALAGITTMAQLHKVGSVAAYARAKQVGANVSLNLLWALEGAMTGLPWQTVAREHRTSLLLALEEYQRRSTSKVRSTIASGSRADAPKGPLATHRERRAPQTAFPVRSKSRETP